MFQTNMGVMVNGGGDYDGNGGGDIGGDGYGDGDNDNDDGLW